MSLFRRKKKLHLDENGYPHGYKADDTPPKWKLETKILPTHSGKFELSASLTIRRADDGDWEYRGLRVEDMEPFSGSAFLCRFNELRGWKGGRSITPPLYENLLAAEFVRGALVAEFYEALDVIKRRREVEPEVAYHG